MPMFAFPIRVKVLLTVVLLVMVVMSLNTSTMANLFRKDKTIYIRDLTSVMAIHVAEEADTLLRHYESNMRAFGDVIYDGALDAETKQNVIKSLFRNYDDIVAITAQRGESAPVTVYDASALTRLDVSRDVLLGYRDANPLVAGQSAPMDVTLGNIKDGVTLLLLQIVVPADESTDSYVLRASFQPERMMSLTARSRGFDVAIVNRDGFAITSSSKDADSSTRHWLGELGNQSATTASTALEFVENGVPMIGAFAPLAGGTLWATIKIPSSVVYLTARELLSNLVIAALLLFALAAAASLVFARRLSKPLERLTDAAGKVGKGEFEVTVTSESSDEIGTLSRSFNQMTEELRQREAKLAGANAALVQSEKLAAFGQLGAGIAHEVKNPLAGILGYTQLALRKTDEESPIRKNLTIIEKETRRCTEIISNLLQFARQETTDNEPMDINAVVDASLQIVDHQLGVNNVRIHRELAPTLPTITGNPNQLQQAIMNFAINAQQAMGEYGGNLTVRTRAADGEQVVIEVEDDGPGIPEDIRAKIFEPFFTTKPAGQGTGLGLSVTYGIIKDHGGDIKIEDVEGGGTRFVVNLPVKVTKTPKAA